MKRDSARSRRQGGLRRAAVMAAVAGAAVLAACSGSPAAAPGTGTGELTAQRMNVLTRALMLMQRDYRTFGQETAPEDVLDYQVGDLWTRGIDGTGTTVAVIEAWAGSPLTPRFLASRDQQLGLPNPQITTIYPTGRHRLPATCPPDMVKLAGYGSCQAWEGEAALDVFNVHLMAPYVKILITVALPDSEIIDDTASQVAPPEFMQAIEYLSVHHLANVISISDNSGESTYAHRSEEIRAQQMRIGPQDS